MGLLHLTTSNPGLVLEGEHRRGGAEAMMAALEAVPEGAPVAILIHGYKFDPSAEGCAAGRDPHSLLFGLEREQPFEVCADWPSDLGFAANAPHAGLCIGFGWPAYARHLSSVVASGRNSLAEAYHRAGEAGATLAELVGALHAVRPDLRFDMFAHSLGARVALSAVGAPGVDRVILLGAAEYTTVAKARMARASGAAVYNFIARQNDPFDLAFELLTTAPEGCIAGALGRAGLGDARPDWIDLQLDNPDLERWLSRRGLPLNPVAAPVCHWSFYTRPGAMALYRTLIRDREDWSICAMRAGGAPEEIAPRWSRLLPRRLGRRGRPVAPTAA